MAAKGGGAWKVAYADFVTAMMAFFLVMWILSQDNKVKEAVATYFKDPFGRAARDEGSRGSSGGGMLVPQLKPGHAPSGEPKKSGTRGPGRGPGSIDPTAAENDPLKTMLVKKPSLLALHDSKQRSVGALVLFAEDSAELDEAAKARLKRLIPDLLGKPNKIEIRGHATNRPLPSGSPYRDAWDLAYARCLATKEFLQSQGIEPERLRLSQGGPFEPCTIREDSPLRLHNSRVEVYMLSIFAEDLVGTPEERAARFLAN
jgi:chemotaxis protein MotB